MVSLVISTIINILLLVVIIITIIIIIIIISTVIFFTFSSFEFNFVRLISAILCRQSVKSIGQKRLPRMVPSQFLYKRLKPLQITSFEH